MSYILIIEDDDDTRETMVSLLEEWGYTVYTAANGVQAITRVQEHPVDLMLVDIHLNSGSDGISVVRNIHTRYPLLPVIFVTALSTAQHTEAVSLQQEYGDSIICGILRKPFNVEELRDRIRRIADTHPTAASHPHTSLRP